MAPQPKPTQRAIWTTRSRPRAARRAAQQGAAADVAQRALFASGKSELPPIPRGKPCLPPLTAELRMPLPSGGCGVKWASLRDTPPTPPAVDCRDGAPGLCGRYSDGLREKMHVRVAWHADCYKSCAKEESRT